MCVFCSISVKTKQTAHINMNEKGKTYICNKQLLPQHFISQWPQSPICILIPVKKNKSIKNIDYMICVVSKSTKETYSLFAATSQKYLKRYSREFLSNFKTFEAYAY